MGNSVKDINLLKSLLLDWDKNPATAYSGSKSALLSAARERGYKNGMKGIMQFLHGQDVYTLPYPVRKQYPVNYYPCFKVGQLFEADLISLLDIKKYNDGYSYILLIIDCVSRFVILRSLKTKGALELKTVLEDVFKTSGISPRYFRTDAGGEFVNNAVKSLFKKLSISHRIAKNTHKAALAENSVRRVMRKLSKYFIHTNNYRYYNILPKVENSLNSTPIRSLGGLSPKDVIKRKNDKELGYDLWSRTVKEKAALVYRLEHISESSRTSSDRDVKRLLNKQRQFKVNDFVRVSIGPHPFRKGYAKNYTTEVFQIRAIHKNQPIWMFTLSDLNKQLIEGNFYPDEMLKVLSPTNKGIYKIERIISSRYNKKTRRKELLVRFEGYNKDFDQYVDESEIVRI